MPFLLCLMMLLEAVPAGAADPLLGTFRSNVYTVTVASSGGDKYSGTISSNGVTYPFAGQKQGPGMVGMIQGNGQAFGFIAVVQGDTMQMKSGDTVYTLVRDRAAAPSGGNPNSTNAGSHAALNGSALGSLAENVKAGLKRNRPETVLAQGDPPLTHASVAAFAEIMRLAFDTQLTETEFAQTAQVFVSYYQNGNAERKKLLATTYQQVLSQMTQGTPEAQAAATAQAREVLSKQFAAGAQAGNAWAALCYNAIQKRQNTIAVIPGPAPEFARKAGLRNTMTEADLDADLEMLYFMWVAAGRDPRLVTPEAVMMVRAAIVQNFPTFPPQLQYYFANGQKMYDAMRGEWAQAGRLKKLNLALQYSANLDQLGLTVPSAQGGRGNRNDAWADMKGQSHSDWAASMVQGLAGSSYHSSW